MHMKKKRLSLIVASVLAMSMSAPVWAGKVAHQGQDATIETDDPSVAHIGGQYWKGVQPETYIADLTTSLTLTSKGKVEELVGGTYAHSGNAAKGSDFAIKSSNIVVDGGSVAESVFVGNKINGNTCGVKGSLGFGTLLVTNGGTTGAAVFGGSLVKSGLDANATGTQVFEDTVKQTNVTINKGSTVNGIFAGSWGSAWNSTRPETTERVLATVEKATIVVDGATINKVKIDDDRPQTMPSTGAIFGGGFAYSLTAPGEITSYVGDSSITVRNGSKVNGDIYAGGFAMKNPDKKTGFSKAIVDRSLITVEDSTVNGNIYLCGEAFNDGQVEVGYAELTLSGATLTGVISGQKAAGQWAPPSKSLLRGQNAEPSTVVNLKGANKLGGISAIDELNIFTGAENKVDGGAPVVTVTGGTLDLSGTEVTIHGSLEGGNDVLIFALKDNASVVSNEQTSLVGAGTFIDQVWTPSEGQTLEDFFDKGVLSTGDLSFTARANSNTKTLSDARLASVALVNQAGEFVADEGLQVMSQTAVINEWVPFGTIHGGSVQYDAGSDIDVDSYSLVTGLTTRYGDTVVAGFIEAGWGDSTSKFDSAKGEGDHTYYGIGLGLRHDWNTGLFADAALHLGMSSTEFSGVYASNGTSSSYDSDAFYFGIHGTAGYNFNLNEQLQMTMYGRYSVNYLDGDKMSLSGTDLHYDADSITTQALRVGLRLTGDVSKTMNWHVGTAYEHVFDGDAEGKLSDIALDTPSLSGNSAILETGLFMKSSESSPWTINLGIKGYAGDREGVTGNATVLYAW